MERLVSIGEAAKALGVSITTPRWWEASGKLVAEHTVGGHRRYDLALLDGVKKAVEEASC